jgi:DNA-binding response OmpR family regulator
MIIGVMDITPAEPPVPGATSPVVAVVDDDDDILELVMLNMTKAGMKVKGFSDAETFYSFLRRERPDIVILDLMLPDADGIEICKFLRQHEQFMKLPIIMLTARSDEIDRVLGLEMGADDYVVKPFSPKELVSRVKAVLRRSNTEVQATTQKVQVGTLLALDLQKHEVTVENRRVEVTAAEFRILQLLASRQGWVFSREKILDFLWGHDKTVSDRTVDVHIRHLREKLGKASSLIRNVRGVGYKLEA